jgi:signal transduction histidine kinase
VAGLLRGQGSVRLRITAAATVVVLLALVVASWLLLATAERALRSSQDDVARGRASELLGLAASGRLPRRLPSLGDDAFAQVVSGDRVLVATQGRGNLGRPPVTSYRPPVGVTVVRTVRDVPDDKDLEDYRVVTATGRSPAGPVTVYVATSVEVVSETVATLRGLLVLGVPAVAVLLGLVAWPVVGRALQPVEAIRAEVGEISDRDLARRVPEPPGGNEVARLARTMNAMLARLDAAARRQRDFVADASHELQSPLTTMRTHLEVALAHPETTDWTAVARALLAEGQEMEALVRDLLFLAREDDSSAEPVTHLVDLDDLVLEESARLRAASSVAIDTTAVSAAPVRGSTEQLRRLVRNLLENAERHAAGRVDLSLSAAGGTVELTVRDDGPGVPRDERERVFDRFVRLDTARARQGSGSGLGLSIVAAVAARHGGTVQVVDGVDGAAGVGATFVVRLPEARSAT